MRTAKDRFKAIPSKFQCLARCQWLTVILATKETEKGKTFREILSPKILHTHTHTHTHTHKAGAGRWAHGESPELKPPYHKKKIK
jgi:hypothetical protein